MEKEAGSPEAPVSTTVGEEWKEKLPVELKNSFHLSLNKRNKLFLELPQQTWICSFKKQIMRQVEDKIKGSVVRQRKDFGCETTNIH